MLVNGKYFNYLDHIIHLSLLHVGVVCPKKSEKQTTYEDEEQSHYSPSKLP